MRINDVLECEAKNAETAEILRQSKGSQLLTYLRTKLRT